MIHNVFKEIEAAADVAELTNAFCFLLNLFKYLSFSQSPKTTTHSISKGHNLTEQSGGSSCGDPVL
jgi:hypothetical protein